MKLIIKSFLIFISIVSFLPAGFTTQQTIISEWSEIAAEAVINKSYGPPQARHILALVHTSIYNAWVPYNSKALSAYDVKEVPRQPASKRTDANKHKAVSYAAYYTLKTLVPDQQSIFDQVMQKYGYSTRSLSPNTKTAAGIGILAARRVIRARWNDRSNWRGDLNPSNQPYSEPILLPGYPPYKYVNTEDEVNDINKWQPDAGQRFTTAHFGLVTTFGLKSGSQVRPKKGPKTTCNDPEGFVEQAQQIYDISQSLTPEQALMAYFWEGAGGINNPHAWFNISREISKRDRNCLDTDVKMFFVFANAFHDSTVAVFDAKRYWNSVRPFTVIQKLIDPDWEPLFETPPLPDFLAGHAATSATVGEILRLFTGSDYYGGSFTDPATGITLSWKTFTDAWKEAGISRMYGGIHYEDAVTVGQKQGLKVAKIVWEKAIKLMEGKRKN